MSAGEQDTGTWVPESCTLPAPEHPLRTAEFDALFASVRGAHRFGPDRLRLELDASGGVAAKVAT